MADDVTPNYYVGGPGPKDLANRVTTTKGLAWGYATPADSFTPIGKVNQLRY